MIQNKIVIGLIAEFNPFHTGHKYLIEQIKIKFPQSYIVCVMSGDFVQRGENAIVDKYLRTDTAIKNGIDLVIELPVEFATSSAKDFSMSAINILDSLSFIDYVCFGSECGNINILEEIAKYLSSENFNNNINIRNDLKTGSTYAKAISKNINVNIESNDILGIEYLLSLKKINSKIKPIIIKRNKSLMSAYDIRQNANRILNDQYKIQELDIYQKLIKYPISFINDFSEYLNYKLIMVASENTNYTKYYDIKEPLSNAIKNSVYDNLLFSDRIKKLKTKNYTYSYISRCLLHIMLDIKKEDVEKLKNENYFAYIRLLGIKKGSEIILKYIVPYKVTSLSPKYTACITNSTSVETNIFASNLYNMVVGNNQNELSRKFIVDMI
ncbi:MAG: nucleotidyltransferase family protein [Eubacteriales bacterium]|nr:nucleotidyltransferase family protein [Eubacteriales bacterium]